MKKIVSIILLASISLFAKLNVVTTYSYLGSIVEEIGKEHVNVNVLAEPTFDPHFVVPKPSLITKLRRAELLIINGGQLEIGWLPPLLRGAQNRELNVGAKGFLDVSGVISMLNKPAVVSRALGDVHPDGNPHFVLDPHNIKMIAKLIAKKLQTIDMDHQADYKQNLEQFLTHWKIYVDNFDNKMKECKKQPLVQYHELFTYFLKRYDFPLLGNLESLPGISPSSKHTFEMIKMIKDKDVKIILQDVYHEKKTAKFVASKTDAEVVVLPHDLGSVQSSENLEKFYNMIEMRLCR